MLLYALVLVLGFLLGIGLMCLFQINREIAHPVEPAPPIAVAKEEPRDIPVYRYDPVSRKPTRRLP